MKKICFALLLGMILSLIAMPAYAWMSLAGSGMLFGNTDYETLDGAIKYIKDEKKLILNNADYNGTRSFIYASEGEIEEIQIVGENKVVTSAYGAAALGGTDVRITGNGSLTIEGCPAPMQIANLEGDFKLTVDGDVEIRLASSEGSALLASALELKNGAKFYAKGGSTTAPSAVSTYEGGISVSGGSEFHLDAYNSPIWDAFDGALTVSADSLAELITNTDFLSDYESYNADSVTVESTRSMSRPDYFAVSSFISSDKNRIEITQSVQEDGRYKAIIRGENIEPEVVPEIPETGDSANLALYAAMLLLGAGLLIRMKKRGNA